MPLEEILPSPKRFEEMPRIETEEGGGFLPRAGAALKASPQGQMEFLRSYYGAENVARTPRDEILIRNPGEQNVWRLFDEKGFSYKDVTADIAGPALQTGVAGGVAIGTTALTGSPLAGAAAGGGAGELARQGVSALLPGSEGLSLGERALSVGVGAGTGAAAQGLVNTGAWVVSGLRPYRIVAKAMQKGTKPGFVQEGLALERETGMQFSTAELTGSPRAAMFEAIGRKHPSSVESFVNHHQQQMSTAVAKLQDLFAKTSPKQGPFNVGGAVNETFSQLVESATKTRSAQAVIDFDLIDNYARGAAVFKPDRLLQEAKGIIDDFDVPGAGDASQNVVNGVKRIRASLTDDAGQAKPLTGQQVNRLLQVYTKLGRGTGVLLKDMDKAQSIYLSNKLKTAMLADLDTAADAGGLPSQIATALKAARDNYRVNSEAIKEFGDSVLAKAINANTPERIAENLLKMRPSEVKDTMALLNNASPETPNAIRRFFLEEALEKAAPAPSTPGAASRVKFSAAKFLSNMPKAATLDALGFDPAARHEIGQIAKALERVADKSLEGSPTASLLMVWDAAQGVFSLNPATLGRLAVASIAPRAIAKAALDPQGRKALLALSAGGTGGTSAKQGLAAAAYFAAILAQEDAPSTTELPTIH